MTVAGLPTHNAAARMVAAKPISRMALGTFISVHNSLCMTLSGKCPSMLHNNAITGPLGIREIHNQEKPLLGRKAVLESSLGGILPELRLPVTLKREGLAVIAYFYY
jgi:hypothetical protein